VPADDRLKQLVPFFESVGWQGQWVHGFDPLVDHAEYPVVVQIVASNGGFDRHCITVVRGAESRPGSTADPGRARRVLRARRRHVRRGAAGAPTRAGQERGQADEGDGVAAARGRNVQAQARRLPLSGQATLRSAGARAAA
jgi:hypothetical protein